MLGDALVVGALAGFISTVLMALFEAPFWRSMGIVGVTEWQVNQILVSRLLGEEHDPRRRLKAALAMHLLHGTVAGAILAAFLFSFLPYRGLFWVAGIAFSILLWSVAPFLLRSRLEKMGNTHFASIGLMVSFLSHLVYGVSLGLILQTLL